MTKNHYNIMAAIAATASIPLLYVASISVIVGDDGGYLLLAVGIALAGMAAVYEARFHRLREWLIDNHSVQ